MRGTSGRRSRVGFGRRRGSWQLNFNSAFFTTSSVWAGKTALIDRHRRAALTCSARDGIEDDAPFHRKVGGRRAAVVCQRTKLRVGSGNVIRHRDECSASRIFDVIVILRCDCSENIGSRAGRVIGHDTILQVNCAACRSPLIQTAAICVRSIRSDGRIIQIDGRRRTITINSSGVIGAVSADRAVSQINRGGSCGNARVINPAAEETRRFITADG